MNRNGNYIGLSGRPIILDDDTERLKMREPEWWNLELRDASLRAEIAALRDEIERLRAEIKAKP